MSEALLAGYRHVAGHDLDLERLDLSGELGRHRGLEIVIGGWISFWNWSAGRFLRQNSLPEK